MTLVKLIQDQPNRYKLEGATLFRFNAPMGPADLRLNTVEALIDRLESPQPQQGKGKRS